MVIICVAVVVMISTTSVCRAQSIVSDPRNRSALTLPIQGSGLIVTTSATSAEFYTGRQLDSSTMFMSLFVRSGLTKNLSNALSEGTFRGSGAAGISFANSTTYIDNSGAQPRGSMLWYGLNMTVSALGSKQFRDSVNIATSSSANVTPNVQVFVGGATGGHFVYGLSSTLILQESNLPSLKNIVRYQDRTLRIDSVAVVERRQEEALSGVVRTWNALEFAADGLYSPLNSLPSFYVHGGLRFCVAQQRSPVFTALLGLYMMKAEKSPLNPGALIGLNVEFATIDYYSLQPVNGPRISIATIIPFS